MTRKAKPLTWLLSGLASLACWAALRVRVPVKEPLPRTRPRLAGPSRWGSESDPHPRIRGQFIPIIVINDWARLRSLPAFGTSPTTSALTTTTPCLTLRKGRRTFINQLLELGSSNPSSHQKGIFHIGRIEANDLVWSEIGLIQSWGPILQVRCQDHTLVDPVVEPGPATIVALVSVLCHHMMEESIYRVW